MKTLKQIMGDLGGYQPKPEGEQNFVKKHVVDKKEDMNGNGDDVFKAAKVKTTDRPGERHGYTDEDDDKINEEAAVVQEVSADLLKRYVTKAAADLGKRVASGESSKPKTTDRAKKLVWAQMMRKYKIIGEEAEDLEEKKLTTAELKKREEIAQAIERENPGIDMGKKMAIATAQAKKVAEAVSPEDKEAMQSRAVAGRARVTQLKQTMSAMPTSVSGGKKGEKNVEHGFRSAIKRDYKKADVAEEIETVEEAKEEKKAAKGKAVMPATGVYDSIPLGISVKEEVSEDIDTSLLEMFVALDEEEQKMFVEMLESDGELLGEIAKEAK